MTPRMVEVGDGVRLAVHIEGPESGAPVVLVHGFLSNARINWFDYGTVGRLTASGFRVCALDLRGHGLSDKPRDPQLFPPDVLARDLANVVAGLDLERFDLAGYSLGARTVARAMIGGLTPRRAVLAGMGLTGLTAGRAGADWYARTLRNPEDAKPNSPEQRVLRSLRAGGADPESGALAIAAGHVDSRADELAALATPTLVLAGERDTDTGSIAELAAALGNAEAQHIPGTHMDAVARPEFGDAIAEFLLRGG